MEPAIYTADDLRAAFDAAPEFTVGLEEEVFVCSPEDGSLVPAAAEVLALAHAFELAQPVRRPPGMLPSLGYDGDAAARATAP